MMALTRYLDLCVRLIKENLTKIIPERMVNESCEAPFLFTLFHIVKLLLILTNLFLFSKYSDKFILSEFFLFIEILAQKWVFRVGFPLF